MRDITVPTNTQMLANHRLRQFIENQQAELKEKCQKITELEFINDAHSEEIERLKQKHFDDQSEAENKYMSAEHAYDLLRETLELVINMLDEQIGSMNYSHAERTGACKTINGLINKRLNKAKWIKNDDGGIPF